MKKVMSICLVLMFVFNAILPKDLFSLAIGTKMEEMVTVAGSIEKKSKAKSDFFDIAGFISDAQFDRVLREFSERFALKENEKGEFASGRKETGKVIYKIKYKTPVEKNQKFALPFRGVKVDMGGGVIQILGGARRVFVKVVEDTLVKLWDDFWYPANKIKLPHQNVEYIAAEAPRGNDKKIVNEESQSSYYEMLFKEIEEGKGLAISTADVFVKGDFDVPNKKTFNFLANGEECEINVGNGKKGNVRCEKEGYVDFRANIDTDDKNNKNDENDKREVKKLEIRKLTLEVKGKNPKVLYQLAPNDIVFLDMIVKCREFAMNKGIKWNKILVNCNSGLDRTGRFCVLDSLLEDIVTSFLLGYKRIKFKNGVFYEMKRRALVFSSQCLATFAHEGIVGKDFLKTSGVDEIKGDSLISFKDIRALALSEEFNGFLVKVKGYFEKDKDYFNVEGDKGEKCIEENSDLFNFTGRQEVPMVVGASSSITQCLKNNPKPNKDNPIDNLEIAENLFNVFGVTDKQEELAKEIIDCLFDPELFEEDEQIKRAKVMCNLSKFFRKIKDEEDQEEEGEDEDEYEDEKEGNDNRKKFTGIHIVDFLGNHNTLVKNLKDGLGYYPAHEVSLEHQDSTYVIAEIFKKERKYFFEMLFNEIEENKGIVISTTPCVLPKKMNIQVGIDKERRAKLECKEIDYIPFLNKEGDENFIKINKLVLKVEGKKDRDIYYLTALDGFETSLNMILECRKFAKKKGIDWKKIVVSFSDYEKEFKNIELFCVMDSILNDMEKVREWGLTDSEFLKFILGGMNLDQMKKRSCIFESKSIKGWDVIEESSCREIKKQFENYMKKVQIENELNQMDLFRTDLSKKRLEGLRKELVSFILGIFAKKGIIIGKIATNVKAIDFLVKKDQEIVLLAKEVLENLKEIMEKKEKTDIKEMKEITTIKKLKDKNFQALINLENYIEGDIEKKNIESLDTIISNILEEFKYLDLLKKILNKVKEHLFKVGFEKNITESTVASVVENLNLKFKDDDLKILMSKNEKLAKILSKNA